MSNCAFGSVWGGSHPGCLNILGNLTGANNSTGDVLKKFDATVTTCAEAMTILGTRLETRVSGSDVIVMSTSSSQFDISLRIGRTDVTATVRPGSGCNFPLAATYAKGADSGQASFGDFTQLLNWLVLRLRR